MHEMGHFLTSLTLVLAVAAVTSFCFHKLRQPVVLGYILAGMIVGPYTPIPLIADSTVVHTLSELGVILLMFSLGLAFNVRHLMKVLPTTGLVALIECAFMMWLGYVAARALGWSTIESFYASAIFAISSTTIIVKAFSELNIKDKVTDIVFGILIAEDLIAVLLLVGLPVLTQQTGASGWPIAKAAGTLFMFLIVLIVGGIILIPRILRKVIRMNRPEITLLVSIGICFAVSLLAKEMGYSVALGAFIAGSLMAESGEEGYLRNLIRPLRDMFAAIFFVSVGMMIDPSVIGNHWHAVLLFALLVIVGKFLGVVVGAFLAGYGTRPSMRAAMSLTQIGEFSFIIAGIGVASGATRNFIYPLAVAVSALTTLATPWMIRGSDPISKWVDRHLPLPLQTFSTLYATWIQRLRQPFPSSQQSRIKRLIFLLLADTAFFIGLVIAASLSMDTLVARTRAWLDLPEAWAYVAGISMTVVFITPFCIGIIRCVRALGGELASRVLPKQESGKLDLAAAPRRVLMVTLQLAIVLFLGVPLLALTQPFIPLYYGAIFLAAILAVLGVVFWRDATQLYGHVQAGAEMVVEMLNDSINKQREIPIIQLEQHLPGLGPVFSIRLPEGSSAIGQTLAELNFRSLTGASVIAITRGQKGAVVPTGDERLEQDDVLAITGSEDAVRLSRQLLLGSE